MKTIEDAADSAKRVLAVVAVDRGSALEETPVWLDARHFPGAAQCADLRPDRADGGIELVDPQAHHKRLAQRVVEGGADQPVELAPHVEVLCEPPVPPVDRPSDRQNRVEELRVGAKHGHCGRLLDAFDALLEPFPARFPVDAADQRHHGGHVGLHEIDPVASRAVGRRVVAQQLGVLAGVAHEVAEGALVDARVRRVESLRGALPLAGPIAAQRVAEEALGAHRTTCLPSSM